MGDQHPPIPRRGSRSRDKLQQRIAQTALDVSYAVARAEVYSQYLADQAEVLFTADAGVGLTSWCLDGSADVDQFSVVVAGVPPLTIEQTLLARPFAETHPGFVAMARVGTAGAARVSDHTTLARFWTTECYWRMHGHSDGRYPASVLLLGAPTRLTFLALHRHDRDFSDLDIARLESLQRPIAAAMSFRAALDDTVDVLRSNCGPKPTQPGSAKHLPPDFDSVVRLCAEYPPTRREGEVLTLAAQGWTNRQIGQRLGITERTVRKHLTAVYDKAGVRGRAAAAAWWQRRRQ